MSTPPITDAPGLAELSCELRAKGQVVRYRRSGSGRPLLLLLAEDEANALWPELLEVLRPGSRLIVPDAPAAGTDVELWLSALLEGLGLSRVTVVASDRFCLAAFERTLLEPDRVARVIMVCRGRGSEAGISGSLDSTPRLGSVPILVLRHDRLAAEVIPLVEAFLDRPRPVHRA